MELELFKFKSITKHLIGSLLKSSLHFPTPSQLNDPFDCNIDIKKSIGNAVNRLGGKAKKSLSKLSKSELFTKELPEQLKKVGICSFSVNKDDKSQIQQHTLMWSHYGDNHRGIYVKYVIPEEFILDERSQIIGFAPVSYDDVNAISKWFESVACKLPMKQKDLFIERSKQLFTVKDPAWSYESEARIIRFKSGTLNIPKEFISEVCFGLQTPAQDISLIQEIIQTYSHKVKRCRAERRDKSDLGITIKEMEI